MMSTTKMYCNLQGLYGFKFEVNLPSLGKLLNSLDMIYLILVRFPNGKLFLKYGYTDNMKRRIKEYMKDGAVCVKTIACFAIPRISFYKDREYYEFKKYVEKELKHEIGIKADKGNEYYFYSDTMLKCMIGAMVNVANIYAIRRDDDFLMFWIFDDDHIPIYNEREGILAEYDIYTNILIKL